LAFKEAVFIKHDDSLSSSTNFDKIIQLKNTMNSKRENFVMPSFQSIRITPYWLLGLIEGEGSFCLNDPKKYGHFF
jgi:hypothetical protein